MNTLDFNAAEASRIMRTAKQEYRKIIERLPEFEKEDRKSCCESTSDKCGDRQLFCMSDLPDGLPC